MRIFKRVSCFVLIALVLVVSVLPIQAKAAVGPMVDLLNLFTAMWNAWGLTVQFNSGSDTSFGPVTEWQQTQLELFLQHIGATFNEWYQGIEYRLLNSGDLWVNPATVLKASEFANWLVDKEGWNNHDIYQIVETSGYNLIDGSPIYFSVISSPGVTPSSVGTLFRPNVLYTTSNNITFEFSIDANRRMTFYRNNVALISGNNFRTSEWTFSVINGNLYLYISTIDNSGSWSGFNLAQRTVVDFFGVSANKIIVEVATGVIGVPDTDTLDPAIGLVVDVGAGAGSDLAGVLDTVVQGVQAGDLAVTMTPATAADVKDDVVPDYGTGADYEVNGLLDLFPFCIPADIYSFINLLVATPETPSFDIPMQFGDIASYTWHFDLHDFDGIAANMRKFELLGFIIALMFVTRDIIRG